MNTKKEVTIIGGGLVGSLLSIYLLKRGYKTAVYERRPDIRKEQSIAGRSINLTLSDRGIKALGETGILDDIKSIAMPMYGRLMHNTDNSIAYQPYGKEGQCLYAVPRTGFNQKLINLAEQMGAKFYFNENCTNIDWDKNNISFVNTKTNDPSVVNSTLTFGSDGAYSTSRHAHNLQQNHFQYEKDYIDYAYKELTIPAGPAGEFLMRSNALHIWPRGNYLMIAMPNINGSFTCTLFLPFEGELSFNSLDSKEKVNSFFENNFSDAWPLMPSLTEEFFVNPTASLVTIKCFPWVRGDKFTLIGDAAHAIVPFYGQGMNCGFEDCMVLNNLMDKYQDDNWQDLLKEFQHLRKPDADAIADLALNNFAELRDKVADHKFLLWKKIEASFSDKYPDKWIPAYSQVTFCPHIRYSEALQNGLKQEIIMQEIMDTPGIEHYWDSDIIEKMILKKLNGKVVKYSH